MKFSPVSLVSPPLVVPPWRLPPRCSPVTRTSVIARSPWSVYIPVSAERLPRGFTLPVIILSFSSSVMPRGLIPTIPAVQWSGQLQSGGNIHTKGKGMACQMLVATSLTNKGFHGEAE